MFWRGDNTELLHHAHPIEVLPLLHNLTAIDAVDGDSRYGHLLARRRDAHQLSFVCGGSRPAHCYLFPLGD